ncbi:hypothetical protein PG993_014910 [Apiospora rasikravindrae]|uniref:Uncharacterized protein n=1 Tax=Apiospora rasikravindrae TaxID=990691 RepID=A0ABR1RP30_9PEZI
MKSSFITAVAASLLMGLSPALALPSQQMHRVVASRNASPEPLDLGNIGDAFKDGWGKVEDGFDKVGDWFKDLPQEVKDLNDTVGDDIKKAAKDAWTLDVGGCLVVQCATALAPTALTCVVSLIDGNPLTCIGAVLGSLADWTTTLQLTSSAVKAPEVCNTCRDAVAQNIGLKSVDSKCSR